MTPSFTSILAATDFSPIATHAVGVAHALAKSLGATLHVVHVCEDPTTTAPWIDGYSTMLLEWRDQLQKGAERQLLALTRSLEGVVTTSEVVLNASPARAIVETAERRGDNLIVIGTHGSSGLTHIVLGSVAERVVRTAQCPVLTVRGAPPASDKEQAPGTSAATRPWLASFTP